MPCGARSGFPPATRLWQSGEETNKPGTVYGIRQACGGCIMHPVFGSVHALLWIQRECYSCSTALQGIAAVKKRKTTKSHALCGHLARW